MYHNHEVFDYLKRATIYEVNIRQYTIEGNFKAFQEHLPRLKEMGVDIIWLMPIHPIGKINRKGSLGSYYSIQNFTEINSEFGTLSDFKNLVDQIHVLGMKIIMDWVANHAAWDNVWTKTNPEYFVQNEMGEFLSPYDWTDVIQINHQNEAAHEAMIASMNFWVEVFDVDGFRADLAHLTPLDFWIKAKQKVDTIKSNLIWLAETEDENYHEVFDISFAWKWMHKTESFCKENQSIIPLKELLFSEKNRISKNGLQLFFTSNHDENSWNGTEYEKYGIFVKAFAVFSFFYSHSVPLIYSGQELPNKKRLSFFDKDTIQWQNELELFSFYQTLSNARKFLPKGDYFHFYDAPERSFIFQRGIGAGALIVMINLNYEINYFNLVIEHPVYAINIFTKEKYHFIENIEFELEAGGFVCLQLIE